MRHVLSLSMIVSATANVAARWPASPITDDDSSLFRQLQGKIGASNEWIIGASHMRLLAEEGGAAPTYEEIASYNIILFVSIALVVIFYFASMALVNMEHMNDSLLYSKSKAD